MCGLAALGASLPDLGLFLRFFRVNRSIVVLPACVETPRAVVYSVGCNPQNMCQGITRAVSIWAMLICSVQYYLVVDIVKMLMYLRV